MIGQTHRDYNFRYIDKKNWLFWILMIDWFRGLAQIQSEAKGCQPAYGDSCWVRSEERSARSAGEKGEWRYQTAVHVLYCLQVLFNLHIYLNDKALCSYTYI